MPVYFILATAAVNDVISGIPEDEIVSFLGKYRVPAATARYDVGDIVAGDEVAKGAAADILDAQQLVIAATPSSAPCLV
jgi:hypothetical protein